VVDRRDKVVRMEAAEGWLDNKCCKATRNRNKRASVKALRQDQKRRDCA
jgi:hypothetical protein